MMVIRIFEFFLIVFELKPSIKLKEQKHNKNKSNRFANDHCNKN